MGQEICFTAAAARLGVSQPAISHTIAISNDYSLVIQSAIEGQGVALGWHHIVGPLVSEGRLVRIGLDEVNTQAAFPVLAKRGPLRPAAKQMLDWLLKEAS